MEEFRIASSQKLNHEFEELCAQAESDRRGLFALETAQEIMRNLQKDATTVGEPLYNLKHLKLQMRLVLVFPWSIHFAVDEARRIVYLSRIALMR